MIIIMHMRCLTSFICLKLFALSLFVLSLVSNPPLFWFDRMRFRSCI